MPNFAFSYDFDENNSKNHFSLRYKFIWTKCDDDEIIAKIQKKQKISENRNLGILVGELSLMGRGQ